MRFRKSRKQAGTVLAAMTVALLLGGAPAQAGALDWVFAWVRSVWESNGAHIDPNGLTVSGPEAKPSDSSDEGPHIDPDGQTVSGPEVKPSDSSDEGMHIDPNG